MADPNTFTPATGGFLAPLDPPPAYDLDLARQIQATVAGITGLDGRLVRPRWQADPPPQPPVTVDWCAVGHTDIRADDNASVVHDPCENAGDGADLVFRGEEITVLASFYGPQASGYARRLFDGFAVQRNRAALLGMGLAFAKPGVFRNVSGLVNTENLIRCDFDFTLRRRVRRTYAVPNIRSAEVTLLHAIGGTDPLRPARSARIVMPSEVGVDPFRVG